MHKGNIISSHLQGLCCFGSHFPVMSSSSKWLHCLTDSRLCNLITNSESTTCLELSRCISTGDHFSNKTVLTQLLKQKHIDAVCRTAASCGSDMHEYRNSLPRQNRISLNMPAGLQILHWLHPHVHMQYLLLYALSGVGTRALGVCRPTHTDFGFTFLVLVVPLGVYAENSARVCMSRWN